MTSERTWGFGRFRTALGVSLALLSFWASVWGGLYLDTAQYVAVWLATAILAGVLGLGLAERRPLASSPTRLAVLALWLAYVAALFVAVTPRLGLQEVVRFGLFAVVFLAASELSRSARAGDGSADGVALSRARPGSADGGASGGPAALLWAAVSLFSLASLVAACAGLSGVVNGGRLYSLMGYPNAAGVLAGAGFLLGLGLACRGGSPSTAAPALGIQSAGQWANLMVVILSLSRGTWLVMPLAGVVVLAAWPRGGRLALVVETGLVGLAALISAVVFPLVYGRLVPGLGLIVAGLVLAVGARWLAGRLASGPGRRQAILVFATIALDLVLAFGLLRLDLVPQAMVDRVTSIGLSDRSAVERLLWSRDALGVVRDYPILGVGGGGWATVYSQYQSYSYYTREIHNDFLEIWVETGTIGFAAWLALLAASGWAVYRLSRRERRPLVAGLAGAVAALVFHCGIDFNLALGATGIALWAFLGILDGLDSATPPPRSRAMKRSPRTAAVPPATVGPRLAILVVTLLLSLISLSLFLGTRLETQATRLLAAGDARSAYQAFERAAVFDPWSVSLRMNQTLACERLYLETKESRYLEEFRTHADQVLALDRLSASAHAFYGTLAFRHGSADLGLARVEEALRLAPYEPRRYADLAAMRVRAGQDHLRRGDRERARQEFEKASSLVGEAATQAGKMSPYAPADSLFEALTPDLALYAGQAELLLGRSDEAPRLLEVAYTSETPGQGEDAVQVAERRAKAALWLSARAVRRGESQAAATYLEFARGLAPDAEAGRADILNLLNQI
jgi:tetratricopeptide (TPR) repeat protein